MPSEVNEYGRKARFWAIFTFVMFLVTAICGWLTDPGATWTWIATGLATSWAAMILFRAARRM